MSIYKYDMHTICMCFNSILICVCGINGYTPHNCGYSTKYVVEIVIPLFYTILPFLYTTCVCLSMVIPHVYIMIVAIFMLCVYSLCVLNCGYSTCIHYGCGN